MLLTAEQRAIGRRTFLKAIAGTPAAVVLAETAARAQTGAPVRLGLIGLGGQGRALLAATDAKVADVRALCDINPASLRQADETQRQRNLAPVPHFEEWRDLLRQADVEAVILSLPLWAHAEVTVACLEAGKHVLCEKMMAWDADGCARMIAAAKKTRRVLEIGYHRYYSPVYQAAYEGVMRRGLLGDVYHARLAWHRNGNWRRAGSPPSPGYDPSRWGYPTYDHLWNWRLYKKYSRGLFAELGSHHINAVNWFLNSTPRAVLASGGVERFKDGRESDDHVYGIFEYPNGVTATFTSIESNAFDQHYEAFFGTKATLVMYNESEVLLFDEGSDGSPTVVESSGTPGGAAIEASETKPSREPAAATPDVTGGSSTAANRSVSLENEITAFCAAIRDGRPVLCGPERASHSALAAIGAAKAAASRSRVEL